MMSVSNFDDKSNLMNTHMSTFTSPLRISGIDRFSCISNSADVLQDSQDGSSDKEDDNDKAFV